MTTQKARPHWIVTCRASDSSHGIEAMVLLFYYVTPRDAAVDAADSIKHEDGMLQYHIDKCRRLNAQTGSTMYFSKLYCHDSFDLRCQRNLDGRHGGQWYGLRLEGGHITDRVCKALAKLVGIEEPNQAIAALGASHATYCSEVNEYVPSEAPKTLDPLSATTEG